MNLSPAELASFIDEIADAVAARMANMPRLVDRYALATIVGCSVATLERLQRDGVIVPIRIGRRCVYDPIAVIDAHLAIIPAMGTVAGEVLAEEYFETNIPARHRRLYLPGMIRAAKMNRVVTPYEIANIRDDLAMLRTIDCLRSIHIKEATQWSL